MNVAYFISRRLLSEGSGGLTKVFVWIAMGTIALSVAVMILSNAMLNGFQKEISDKIFNFWGHIHITDSRIIRNTEQAPIALNSSEIQEILAINQLPYFDEVKKENLTTIAGVDRIQSYIFVPGILNRKKTIEGILLKGVGSNFDPSGMDVFLQKGKFITHLDSTASRDLVISQQTANRLEVDIEDKINISFYKRNKEVKKSFKVSGIYKTGLEEYDEKFAIIDIKIAREILGWEENQVGGYEVFLNNKADMIPIADHIYTDILPHKMYAETIKEKLPSNFDWLDLQSINETIILSLMTVVAIINLATILLILILERNRMIGIMKSFGSSSWTIRKIFIYTAAYILLIGVVLGNVVGLGLCYLQDKFKWISLDESSYYLSYAPIHTNAIEIILINLGIIICTLLFMILPSYIITNIKPLKVLRFN